MGGNQVKANAPPISEVSASSESPLHNIAQRMSTATYQLAIYVKSLVSLVRLDKCSLLAKSLVNVLNQLLQLASWASIKSYLASAASAIMSILKREREIAEAHNDDEPLASTPDTTMDNSATTDATMENSPTTDSVSSIDDELPSPSTATTPSTFRHDVMLGQVEPDKTSASSNVTLEEKSKASGITDSSATSSLPSDDSTWTVVGPKKPKRQSSGNRHSSGPAPRVLPAKQMPVIKSKGSLLTLVDRRLVDTARIDRPAVAQIQPAPSTNRSVASTPVQARTNEEVSGRADTEKQLWTIPAGSKAPQSANTSSNFPTLQESSIIKARVPKSRSKAQASASARLTQREDFCSPSGSQTEVPLATQQRAEQERLDRILWQKSREPSLPTLDRSPSEVAPPHQAGSAAEPSSTSVTQPSSTSVTQPSSTSVTQPTCKVDSPIPTPSDVGHQEEQENGMEKPKSVKGESPGSNAPANHVSASALGTDEEVAVSITTAVAAAERKAFVGDSDCGNTTTDEALLDDELVTEESTTRDIASNVREVMAMEMEVTTTDSLNASSAALINVNSDDIDVEETGGDMVLESTAGRFILAQITIVTSMLTVDFPGETTEEHVTGASTDRSTGPSALPFDVDSREKKDSDKVVMANTSDKSMVDKVLVETAMPSDNVPEETQEEAPSVESSSDIKRPNAESLTSTDINITCAGKETQEEVATTTSISSTEAQPSDGTTISVLEEMPASSTKMPTDDSCRAFGAFARPVTLSGASESGATTSSAFLASRAFESFVHIPTGEQSGFGAPKSFEFGKFKGVSAFGSTSAFAESVPGTTTTATMIDTSAASVDGPSAALVKPEQVEKPMQTPTTSTETGEAHAPNVNHPHESSHRSSRPKNAAKEAKRASSSDQQCKESAVPTLGPASGKATLESAMERFVPEWYEPALLRAKRQKKKTPIDNIMESIAIAAREARRASLSEQHCKESAIPGFVPGWEKTALSQAKRQKGKTTAHVAVERVLFAAEEANDPSPSRPKVTKPRRTGPSATPGKRRTGKEIPENERELRAFLDSTSDK